MTLMSSGKRQVRRDVAREPRTGPDDAEHDQAFAVEPELARLLGCKTRLQPLAIDPHQRAVVAEQVDRSIFAGQHGCASRLSRPSLQRSIGLPEKASSDWRWWRMRSLKKEAMRDLGTDKRGGCGAASVYFKRAASFAASASPSPGEISLRRNRAPDRASASEASSRRRAITCTCICATDVAERRDVELVARRPFPGAPRSP